MSDFWNELGYRDPGFDVDLAEAAVRDEATAVLGWPRTETVTVELKGISPDTFEAMVGRLGGDIGSDHPRSSVTVTSKVPGHPKYVEPTGWRRFIPGAESRATRDWKRAMEAWLAAGAPDLTKVAYIPRAVFVPKENHDG